MARMVQIGAPSIVLETEHVEQMSNNPDWGAAVAHAQKTIMEEYHDEYGIKCALRHTIGDIREDRNYLQLRGDKYNTFMEAFEECAKAGADMLSVESMGGKEIFDYSILRNDTAGILFGIGVLGSMDMEMIWKDITAIAKKTGRFQQVTQTVPRQTLQCSLQAACWTRTLPIQLQSLQGQYLQQGPFVHTKPVQLVRVRTADMRM